MDARGALAHVFCALIVPPLFRKSEGRRARRRPADAFGADAYGLLLRNWYALSDPNGGEMLYGQRGDAQLCRADSSWGDEPHSMMRPTILKLPPPAGAARADRGRFFGRCVIAHFLPTGASACAGGTHGGMRTIQSMRRLRTKNKSKGRGPEKCLRRRRATTGIFALSAHIGVDADSGRDPTRP